MILHVNTLALIRVTLKGFLGFYRLAGLSFGLMGLGSGLGAGVSIGVGSDAEVAFMWKSMLPLTQSINGL